MSILSWQLIWPVTISSPVVVALCWSTCGGKHIKTLAMVAEATAIDAVVVDRHSTGVVTVLRKCLIMIKCIVISVLFLLVAPAGWQVGGVLEATVPGSRFDVPKYHHLGSLHIFWLASYFKYRGLVSVWRDNKRVRVLLYCLDCLPFQSHDQAHHSVRHSDLYHDVSLSAHDLVRVQTSAGLLVVPRGTNVCEMFGSILYFLHNVENGFLLAGDDEDWRLCPHGRLDVRVRSRSQIFYLAP